MKTKITFTCNTEALKNCARDEIKMLEKKTKRHVKAKEEMFHVIFMLGQTMVNRFYSESFFIET